MEVKSVVDAVVTWASFGGVATTLDVVAAMLIFATTVAVAAVAISSLRRDVKATLGTDERVIVPAGTRADRGAHRVAA